MQFDLAQLPEALGHEMGCDILDAGILNYEQFPGGLGAVDAVVITGRSIVFVEESAWGRIPAGAIVLLPAADQPKEAE